MAKKSIFEELTDDSLDKKEIEKVEIENKDQIEEQEKKSEEEEKKKRGRPAKQKEEISSETKEEEIEKEEDKKDELDEASLFYTDVAKVIDINFEEVDFGNVDPLSPEGFAKVVTHEREKLKTSLEEYLSQVAPIEYQALVMRINGGDPSQLYDKTGFVDYSKIEITEEDLDIQKELIRREMELSGIPKERQEKLIKVIESEGELYDEAVKSQKSLIEKQKEQLEKETLKTKQQKEQEKQTINSFVNLVNDTIGKGEIGNFQVLEKDKKPFFDFVRENVRYINGEFIVTNSISQDNYDQVMKSLYFQFKGGNLKELVEKQAKSQNVIKLRRALNDTNKNPSGQDLLGEVKTKPSNDWRAKVS